MSVWPMVALGEVMVKKAPSINPNKHKDDSFALYSIPAFDAGHPEMINGSEIGSAKKIARPGDVMLSRIVPHIRRACVVKNHDAQHIAASGEWIAFRDPRVFPDYLRHTLIGDPFHYQFMQTVAGVGGSLLRARPEAVSRIQIPLPPLAEQKRIAAILDKADDLRRKRRQALALLDTLTQSIFVEMFGDPVRGKLGVLKTRLEEVVSRIQIGPFGSILHKSDYEAGGICLVNPKHIVKERIRTANDVSLSIEKYSTLKRYQLKVDDVVMSRRGEMGRCAIVRSIDGPLLCGTGSLYIRHNSNYVSPYFLQSLLSSRSAVSYFENASAGVTMSNLNKKVVADLLFELPSIESQKKYELAIKTCEREKHTYEGLIDRCDTLFASLQSRAFSGQL